ncbi:transcription termination factor NusA [Ferruginibacter sp. SUN002]|uniref:transcription termination factor NusA n=1 Tax=Ferruginibacter sp. SUN002 TaxID=2937789 RepID=UPI003D361756
MARINLIDSFQEFKDAENIDRPTLMKVMEDVFKTLIRKKYGSDEQFDVIVNDQKGDLEIFRRRTIVDNDDLYNTLTEIEYKDAILIEPDYQVGEELYEEVDIQKEFGRRAILAGKQTLASRINDLKKNLLIKKYDDRIGEIVSGEVYQVWKKEVLLLDEEGNEMILPKSEQIPSDYFKKGETVRGVVKKVELKNSQAVIVVSRTSPAFLEKLLEIEVPEIFDGLIVVKKIVRDPGERAKIAVESFDDRIDPVGACVGMKGSRIHGIVRELKNENIDVINWTSNIQLLIQRSLTPAKITSIDLDEETKRATVYLKPDQVSLAIGRRGVNIKLACELTGYEIDVFRDAEDEVDEFDIDLDEFTDEIEPWIIDELKRVGCDTGRSVLALTAEELERRTDLEKETIEDVRRVLKEEFEKE